jgi:hypothetical protein
MRLAAVAMALAALVRHVRASRSAAFVVSFPAVDACAGVSGVATGSCRTVRSAIEHL